MGDEKKQSFGLRQYQNELQLIENELNGVIGRCERTIATHDSLVDFDEVLAPLEDGGHCFWDYGDELKKASKALYQLRRRLEDV